MARFIRLKCSPESHNILYSLEKQSAISIEFALFGQNLSSVNWEITEEDSK
jgi:hypothetical protein